MEGLRPAYNTLRMHPQVKSVTLMTHFADADGAGIREQLAWFEELTGAFDAPRSLANSAALLRYPESRRDWVRPGIMLYGCSPFADQLAQALDLRPAMTLVSETSARKNFAGESIGYGFTYTAVARCIGVVGLRRRPASRGMPSGTPIWSGERTA